MEILLGLAAAFGLWFALLHGLEAMGRAAVAKYRARRAAWATNHPGPEAAGRKVASGVACAFVALFAVRTFWRAARSEYPRARDRYRRRWGIDPAEPTPPTQPTPPAATEPPASTPSAPTSAPPAVVPAPTIVRRPDPVSTAVHSEVSTVGAARTELETLRDRVIVEFDASGALLERARANADAAVSLAEQAMVVFDKDPATAAAIVSVADQMQLALNAAEQIVVEFEAALGQINVALRQLNATHSSVEEAHAATPEASRREAYQNA